VKAGEDPQAEKAARRKAETISELLDRYLDEHVERHNAPNTARAVKDVVNRHLRPALGTLPVKALTLQDAAGLHHKLRATPRTANHAITLLSVALNLAEEWGLRPLRSNPLHQIKRFPETRRERFLSLAELERLGRVLAEAEGPGLPWRAKQGEPSAGRTRVVWQAVAAIRLLLFTGARMSEITELRWRDVDLESGRLGLPKVKGGPRVLRSTSAAALAVLAGLAERAADRSPAAPVLPSADDPARALSKTSLHGAWARLRAAAGLEDVHLHDLRHTVGTHAGQLGVAPFVIRDALRHSAVATTDRYVNFDDDPTRAALDAVAERLKAGLGTGQAPEPHGKEPDTE
jgi:integrase